MTEAQILLLINSLSTSIPSLVALYRTITANRQGTKTIYELLADADTQYDAVIAAAQAELDKLPKV